ncbi:TolC family outer membrane protein [Moritella viscosa]|uniref:Type I secretion outer membrane protein n=1 Tax=Moritella viscosa TaxID=80854 RepID=A0A1L0BD74_9GAMM|nr:TolC family outer membrane protein [Moritella viscosa]SGZ01300.1 Type I secretion outer membrane protein [Moritella viscosa]SHO06599.1 Type I secretion outer membrane protein [Moritella viscosa]SHO06741.1 Type I secretion outer membrane protein [Moritella viscosa]SHO10410.1 Type I secretion outer membrane protein [Moritella viscosa]SHO14522.1 Type I secretion outer membrane protein [Moritella viscosa]
MKFNKILLACGLAFFANSASADNLQQIFEQALTKDPLYLEAQANRNAALERITEQEAANLPKISLSADLGYTVTSDYRTDSSSNGNALTGNVGIGLTQSLYEESNFINVSQAAKQAEQSELAVQAELQGLILRVSNAYFNVLSANDTLEFSNRNKEAVERQLEQTTQRYNVGLTDKTDVLEAQSSFDLSVAEVINAENTLANSYESLTEITGLTHTDISPLNTARFSPTAPNGQRDNWLDIANNQNLSIQIQRIAKQIAEGNVDLANSTDNISLNLVANAGAKYTDYGNDNNNGGAGAENTVSSGNVGIKFSMPLYTGGAVTSAEKQAVYQVTASQEQLTKASREVQTKIRTYYNNVTAALSSIKAYEQTVKSSESALEATQAGFGVGTRTIIDVLNATKSLYQSKQSLSASRYNYIISMLQLKQAAGTLNAEDISLVNAGLEAQY